MKKDFVFGMKDMFWKLRLFKVIDTLREVAQAAVCLDEKMVSP